MQPPGEPTIVLRQPGPPGPQRPSAGAPGLRAQLAARAADCSAEAAPAPALTITVESSYHRWSMTAA